MGQKRETDIWFQLRQVRDRHTQILLREREIVTRIGERQ